MENNDEVKNLSKALKEGISPEPQFSRGKVIESHHIKKLVDYLAKQSDGKHTEFRVVIRNNGTGYAHVQDKDCESLDFELPSFFKRNNNH